MIKNYIKTTLRHLWRNRLFTLLNILGLAIGISACWIVFTIVDYELSFDKKVPDAEQIYQVVTRTTYDGNTSGFGGVPLGVAPAITAEMPEVSTVVPVYDQYVERIFIPRGQGEAATELEEEEHIIGTRSEYFNLVPYEWIAGGPETAFNAPNSMVLTEDRARQYFPEAPLTAVVGKTVTADTTLFMITGIVKGLPYPSSFTAKTFIPIPDKEWNNHNWRSMNSAHKLFVKTGKKEAIDQMLALVNKKYDAVNAKEDAEAGYKTRFDVLPLPEKHFSREYTTGGPVADSKVLYGLMAIGGFLLLLACINYINLSTAQVPQRVREIGIRKTLGGRPLAITVKFLVETLVITLCALLLSWPATSLFQIVFPEFFPAGLDKFHNYAGVIAFLLVLILVITLLSGMYPAFLINRVQTAEALKGRNNGLPGSSHFTLRRSLIVFQFVIAQFFIVSAMIIGQQLNYTLNKDLGFTHDAVVNIHTPYKSYQGAGINPFLYKQALQKYPEIAGVALGHEPLSNNHWGGTFHVASDTGKIQINCPRKYIDQDYLDVYGIELLAGTNLVLRDSMQEILINNVARKALGFETPEAAVGQWLTDWSNTPHLIAGVVKDFHQKNLRMEIEPLVLATSTKRGSLQTFNIKLYPDRSSWEQALKVMEQEWKTVYPNAPFEYKFSDDRIKTLYESEHRMSKLIGLATGITIFVSCLGLFGLATLTAFQRTKEIGIRKVLGATVTGITTLLSKDFIKLILIALVIASPIAWWAMNQWLEDFAYRIDIQWWTFFIAGLIAVVIALITISSRAIKAAMANPVKSLKVD